MGKLTKRECGALGGRATLAKYGPAHMARIAALGGRAFWAKYTLRPVGPNDFAIIDRATDTPTGRTLNGYYLPPRKD